MSQMVGKRVRLLIADLDHDENDEERLIPAGTIGTLARLNHVDSRGNSHYDVFWENDGWTIHAENEFAGKLELMD